MPELVFALGSEVLFRAPLNVRSFRVGQNPLNDLALPGDDIAPFQASFDRDPDGAIIMVDRSGRGTNVNGQLRDSTRLKDGDKVRLGRLVATLDASDGPARTTRLTTGEVPAVSSRVSMIAPDGRRIPVTESGVKVGKDPMNDVVVDDGFVSGFHLLVFRRQGAVVVRDLGSTNGTWVNGLRITEVETPPDVTITLGKVELRLAADDRRTTGPARQVDDLIYADPTMDQVAQAIRSVAPHDAAVCITGESGCGKELVARAIHRLGPRKDLPFVAVNCAALSPNLVESELFGHERGAFTGADRARVGAFEEAGRGTLFLDEVGDLPPDAQAKMLRALENREIRRVGSDATRKIHCRIVTATHQDLHARVAGGAFRNDLFHRLTVLPIRVPPLRDRRGDIPVLANHFLATFGEVALTPAALEKLKGHSWPGNVRELRNVLTQALVFSGKRTLDAADITFPPIGLKDLVEEGRVFRPGKTLADIEQEAIEQAVETLGSQSAAARELGISRSTIIDRMKNRRKK